MCLQPAPSALVQRQMVGLYDLWVRSLAEHLYFAVEAEKRGKRTIGIDIRNGIGMNIVITEMWKFFSTFLRKVVQGKP